MPRKIKKINLSHPKNQLLAIIFIFSIIGGGYFTLNSFADSLTSDYTPEIGNVGGFAFSTVDVSENNRSSQIYEIEKGGYIYTKKANTQNGLEPVAPNNKIRFCINARVDSPEAFRFNTRLSPDDTPWFDLDPNSDNSFIAVWQRSTGAERVSKNASLSDQFTHWCTNWEDVHNWNYAQAAIMNTSDSSKLQVKSITIEKQPISQN